VVKIRKSYFVIGVCCLFCSFIKQDSAKPLVIKATHNFFTADNLKNIYLVSQDELVKHLATGKFFARYSNLKLGNITLVDATNPLKVLLYYRDFQQIVFLDNQLSENSTPVSLEQLGYEQTELACAGANNSFWIYNKQNNELIRFDESSRKISSTGNLKQVLKSDLTPNCMLEHNGYLFLNCPETGIYVFDIFGAFARLITLKNLKSFQVSESIIYYQKDSLFCSYNYKLFEEACKKIPSFKNNNAKYFNNKLYYSIKDSLFIETF
jgi:hypothetical protein